jgi:hypothetical protein
MISSVGAGENYFHILLLSAAWQLTAAGSVRLNPEVDFSLKI